MTETALRRGLIRLAHAQPALRPHLLPLLKQAAMMTPLYGHDSPANAYVVEDYPYGFKLRTTIRYWLEMSSSKGFRFVSQTMDPKRGGWNKPKASTFARLAGVMFLDEKGHVAWDGLTEYSDAIKVGDFLDKYPKADRGFLKKWIPAKIRYYEKILDANAEGRSGWSINNAPEPVKPADVTRNQAELAAWTAALKKL